MIIEETQIADKRKDKKKRQETSTQKTRRIRNTDISGQKLEDYNHSGIKWSVWINPDCQSFPLNHIRAHLPVLPWSNRCWQIEDSFTVSPLNVAPWFHFFCLLSLCCSSQLQDKMPVILCSTCKQQMRLQWCKRKPMGNRVKQREERERRKSEKGSGHLIVSAE